MCVNYYYLYLNLKPYLWRALCECGTFFACSIATVDDYRCNQLLFAFNTWSYVHLHTIVLNTLSCVEPRLQASSADMYRWGMAGVGCVHVLTVCYLNGRQAVEKLSFLIQTLSAYTNVAYFTWQKIGRQCQPDNYYDITNNSSWMIKIKRTSVLRFCDNVDVYWRVSAMFCLSVLNKINTHTFWFLQFIGVKCGHFFAKSNQYIKHPASNQLKLAANVSKPLCKS